MMEVQKPMIDEEERYRKGSQIKAQPYWGTGVSPGRTGDCVHIYYATQDIVKLRLCPWETQMTKMEQK